MVRKRAKLGRPEGSTGKARDELIQMRVNAVEKQGFSNAAQLSGLTVSAWARERLRCICREELETAGQNVPFLSGQDERKTL